MKSPAALRNVDVIDVQPFKLSFADAKMYWSMRGSVLDLPQVEAVTHQGGNTTMTGSQEQYHPWIGAREEARKRVMSMGRNIQSAKHLQTEGIQSPRSLRTKIIFLGILPLILSGDDFLPPSEFEAGFQPKPAPPNGLLYALRLIDTDPTCGSPICTHSGAVRRINVNSATMHDCLKVWLTRLVSVSAR